MRVQQQALPPGKRDGNRYSTSLRSFPAGYPFYPTDLSGHHWPTKAWSRTLFDSATVLVDLAHDRGCTTRQVESWRSVGWLSRSVPPLLTISSQTCRELSVASDHTPTYIQSVQECRQRPQLILLVACCPTTVPTVSTGRPRWTPGDCEHGCLQRLPIHRPLHRSCARSVQRPPEPTLALHEV